MSVVTDAAVIAKIPRQRPVVGRNDCYPDKTPFLAPFCDAVYFCNELQCFSTRVSVDINIVWIVVVIIREVEIDGLIPVDANSNHPDYTEQAQLRQSLIIEHLKHMPTDQRQWHKKIQRKPRCLVGDQ